MNVIIQRCCEKYNIDGFTKHLPVNGGHNFFTFLAIHFPHICVKLMTMAKSDDNKLQCSAALSYILNSKAPIIVAAGKGDTAKKINRIAEKHGIKIVKDSGLANILSAQHRGMCIPPETYSAVAAVFAFLKKKQ